MNVGVLTFQNKHGRPKGSIGSSVIRGDWLIDKWDEATAWKNGGSYDAIIFQKVYWKYYLEDYKGIKILDLCDPDWLKCEINLVEISLLVDAITCSTESLAEQVRKYVKHIPVVCVPDRLNLDLFKNKKQHHTRAEKVVWFGYMGNAREVLPMVLPSLARRNLKLLIVSNEAYTPLETYGVEIINTQWLPETAYTNIQTADFAINPISFKNNFRHKSNNKTLVSWGLGLPVANTADEMDLFLDPDERQKEIDKRTKEIEDKWNIELSIKQYKELICNIEKTRENKS